MMRRPAPALSTFALLLFALTLGPGRAAVVSAGVGGVPGAAPAPSPLQPATTGGLAAVDRALAKLSTHRRMLVIGAHPDDEDTSLLTLVSRGEGGEAAYLSLSRGEGGQNLIGPELGVGLGLIRTRELLAAREIDGGRQYFTRAFDFGFTRSLDETLKLWPKEAILSDAVRVVRRFKPQVVVAVFPPTAQAGHGQHQEAGVIAPEAYRLAGDPAAFPQLLAQGEGLVPWKPLAFYRAAWFDRKAATMDLPLGGIDPLTGKSNYQLAMASRSMHRSQDMGRLQELGGPETRLAWVEGGAGKEGKGIFAGIDTHLAAIAAPLPEGEAKRDVASHLAQAEAAALKARAALSPERLADAAPALAEILKHLEAARAALGTGQGEALAVADLLEEKIAVAETGLAAAAGIAVDAAASREAVTPGSAVEVETTLWNGGKATLDGVAVALVSDWGDARPAATGEAAPLAERLAPGEKKDHKASFAVPAGTPLTLPYFLRRPLQGDLYDWSEAAPVERGEPFGPPPLTARFTFRFAGVPVTIDREVVYRRQDEALGEVRRPLRVVPRVEVATADSLVLWPLPSGKPRRIDVTLTSHSADPESGKLVVQPAASWPARASYPFRLAPGAATKIEVPLAATSALAPGRYSFTLTAELDSGEKSGVGGMGGIAVPVIEYPHIRPTPQPMPATVEVSAADLRLPPLRKVGYVRGASDRVPEFLLQVGVPLVLLGPADLANGDLSGYDAIVIGSRAYETEPALGRANGRLLDYAKKGGLVVVQYQQYPYVEGHYAPFALDIARPHDRVTDETAAVKLLDPANPVFNTPNRLGPADWEGWVQERGLYFAHTWGPEWKPLLAMADPGGPELQGSLLVAPVGKGTYVYTGLALFRQLPAGVPGAYRLFANLLALGRKGR